MRNLSVKLFRKEKRSLYNRLTISDITDNKKFWKTVKPAFSDKCRSNSKNTLIENDTLILNDKKVAETMKDYLLSITDLLCLKENSEITISTEGVSDPIARAIIKYSKRPSIRKIRSSVHKNNEFFKSQATSLEQMNTEIERLNPTKATIFRNIPAKLLKSSSSICAKPMQFIFINCTANGLFPDLLKLADVTSLHKGDERTSTKNCRPLSVLPTVCKVFERLMNKQITNCIEPCLSSVLCGFRKG